jgi:hypothetical protein
MHDFLEGFGMGAQTTCLREVASAQVTTQRITFRESGSAGGTDDCAVNERLYEAIPEAAKVLEWDAARDGWESDIRRRMPRCGGWAWM